MQNNMRPSLLVIICASYWTTVNSGRTASGDYNSPIRQPYDSFPRLPLPTSFPTHPRLVWTDEQVSETVQIIQQNTDANALYNIVVEHGNILLADQSMTTGLWDYVYTLGGLHRLECMMTNQPITTCNTIWSTNGIPFLLRTARQTDSCGDCGNNNNCTGMSFYTVRTAGLCYATLGHSLAIGYDWFFHSMNDTEKLLVSTSITNQILDVYAEGISAAFVHEYWYESFDNFNTAINTGAIMGVLAVAGNDDILYTPNRTLSYANDAFTLAIISLQRSTANAFLPDGGHPEGPTYGTFGMNWLQPCIDALQTTLNNTYGLSLNITASGRYLVDLLGPSSLYIDWADTAGCTGTNNGCSLFQFEYNYVLAWYAQKLNQQNPGSIEAGALSFVARTWASALNTTWGYPGHYEPKGIKYLINYPIGGNGLSDLSMLIPSRLMNNTNIAFIRNGWNIPAVLPNNVTINGPGSTMVSIKGCDNHIQQIVKATTHTHADCGQFSIDMGGIRWFTDLGSGPYGDPGYFSLQKWDFYNAGTIGHNTLMFDNFGQDACTTWGTTGEPENCKGIFTVFEVQNTTSGDAFGILDISGVYQMSAGLGSTVHRGITMKTYTNAPLPQQTQDWIGIRDELSSFTASNVTWNFHTFATVTSTIRSSSPANILRASLTATTPTGIIQSLDMVFDISECPSAIITSNTEVPVTNLTVISVTGYQNNCQSLSIVTGLSPIPDTAPGYLQPLATWTASNNPWSTN